MRLCLKSTLPMRRRGGRVYHTSGELRIPSLSEGPVFSPFSVPSHPTGCVSLLFLTDLQPNPPSHFPAWTEAPP